MAPETAETRPARNGPRLRQERPASSEGGTGPGPVSVGVVKATRANKSRKVFAVMDSGSLVSTGSRPAVSIHRQLQRWRAGLLHSVTNLSKSPQAVPL